MNIRLWRVLLFVLIIVGSTLLIYPFPRDMVELYLAGGEISKASELLDRLLEENPDDPGLLSVAADVYIYRGMPDKAITCLNRVLAKKLDNKEILGKLALFYEWSVMPREAMHTWERLAAILKQDEEAFRKLIMYYRYFDMLPQEIDAILHLNTLLVEKPGVDLFTDQLNREIFRLGAEKTARSEDPYLDYLIRGIFVVGEQFRAAADSGTVINSLQYMIYVMEYFVSMDRVEEGYNFARRMDQKMGGTNNRLQLVRVLGWAGEFEQGLEIAQRLFKENPDNTALLTEMAWISRSAGRLDVAEAVLEKLISIEPDNSRHQEELGRVYMESGRYDKAVDLFRRMAEKLNNWFKYAHDMLRAALYSSDPKLMAQVVAETEDLNIDDSEYMRTRADALLALNRPYDAYDVLKQLIQRPDVGVADYERMVDAATATKDSRLIADTIDAALEFSPGNIDLMRRGAEAWREAGDPVKGYDFYRKVVQKSGLEEDVINMLLTASDTNNLKLAREAAKYALDLYPKNAKVIAQAGEIMLWLNSPKDAYPFYRKAAILTGGSRELVMKLVQVASYTGDSKIFRDAALTAIRLRPDDEQVAMLAASVLSAAGDNDRAAKLLSKFSGRKEEQLDMLLKWAEFADGAGLNEEAYRIYDRLYTAGYRKKKVRKELARLAGWTNRPKVAAGLYGEMADEVPSDFDLAMQAGGAYSDAGEYVRAVTYYRRALALRPGDNALRLKLAETYGFANMNAERIELYTELWREGLLPENGRVELARAYLDAKDPESALKILEPYAKLKRLHRFEGFLLASALQQAGRKAEASAIYERLGKEYGTDSVFLSRLGAEALFNNAPSEAYELFSSALKVDPQDRTALKGLGIILADRQQYKRAVSNFRHYLKLVPDDAEARYQLAEIYRLLGREAEADRQYRLAERLISRKADKNIFARKVKLLDR